jgi:hypothetical protein
MSKGWRRLQWGPWPGFVLPPGQPSEETRVLMELPRSLRPMTDSGFVQRPVFDPSLKHYARAMRAGDPQFEDPDKGAAWYEARRQAVGCILAGISGSPWADHLMLRGSFLLRAWFGDAAREPNDLDFVVIPTTWQIGEAGTQTMLSGIAEAAAEVARSRGAVRIDPGDVVLDDIWTYDRVPGLRMILPWSADGVPSGNVQLDFVFNEELSRPPEQQEIPISGGPDVLLNVASRELSLAWKILWLVTDMYPQAKDLYDAVLLAETVTLPARLLREVFVASDTVYASREITEMQIIELECDWEEHEQEHPIAGQPGVYIQRLAMALIPTFAEPLPEPDDPYERRAYWLAPRVDALRTIYASSGMEGLQQTLYSQQVYFYDALVITREVIGRDTASTEEIATAMIASPALRAAYGRYEPWDSPKFAETLRELRWPK